MQVLPVHGPGEERVYFEEGAEEVCPVRECSVVLERLPSEVVCGKRVSCSSLSSSASCAKVRVNDDNSDVECVFPLAKQMFTLKECSVVVERLPDDFSASDVCVLCPPTSPRRPFTGDVARCAVAAVMYMTLIFFSSVHPLRRRQSMTPHRLIFIPTMTMSVSAATNFPTTEIALGRGRKRRILMPCRCLPRKS